METLHYNKINLKQKRALVGKPLEVMDQITNARITALHYSATMPSSEFSPSRIAALEQENNRVATGSKIIFEWIVVPVLFWHR